MTQISIASGELRFTARLEERLAPRTCERFRTLLPWSQRLIHVRWSGEACWIPLQDLDLELGYENHTSYPSPGQVLLYPGGFSETEVLVAYGGVRFASVVGQLAGNHFMTIESGLDELRALGERCLWAGAQEVVFEDHDG